jgi:hypothetical protein
MADMLPPVLQHMESLGHAVFSDGDYDLNLFGVRSPDQTDATFNDWMGCAYKKDGEWVVRWWQATTDPGLYYRQNPMNVGGTAILQCGQYRGVYKIDKHAGKYEALCQRNGVVTVWRDRNKDDVLDWDTTKPWTGHFGINLHASSSTPYGDNRDRREGGNVGKWSAGCQVHATTRGFREMMELARKQVSERGWDSFTYTLMDQWWK